MDVSFALRWRSWGFPPIFLLSRSEGFRAVPYLRTVSTLSARPTFFDFILGASDTRYPSPPGNCATFPRCIPFF